MTNRNIITINGLAAAIAIINAIPTMANTTEWLVTPQYDFMEFFAPDIYKVTVNGKIGLIDTNGREVLAPKYDLIMDYHEGTALFGDYTSDGFVIRGNITSDNIVSHATDIYYVLNEYPFYSEGYIPVMDRSGRYGYLDENCRPAFKFGNDETRPFSEGFAAVGEGDDFHWLTTNGENIFLSLPNGSYPYGGTNFYNGIAYLWDEYGEDFYMLDDSGNMKKIKPRDLRVDYLYRVDTGLGSSIDYTKFEGRYDLSFKPTQKNGKWAYSDSKGNLLSTFQYDDATYFQGISAPAKANGKWGLLQVVEDDQSFFVKSDKKLRVFSGSKGSECAFQLSIPDKWKGESLIVTLKDPESGETIELNKKAGNEYSFTYHPDKSKKTVSKSFAIDVMNDDILLWQGEESYDFAQAIKLGAALSVKTKADANNYCYVTATISNPSSIPVSTTVTLSGGGRDSQFSPKKVNLTIPANSHRSVQSAFIMKGVVEFDGWCSVTTSDGTQARKSNLQLKPRD